MSYRANCKNRRIRRQAEKRRGPRIVSATQMLKWVYPKYPHPQWVLTAIKFGWMTKEEGRVAEEKWWAEQGPPKMPPLLRLLYEEQRGIYATLARSIDLMSWRSA